MENKEIKIIKENKLLDYPLLRKKLFNKFYPDLDFADYYYSTFWFSLIIQEYPQLYQKMIDQIRQKCSVGIKIYTEM